jgi:hypothetical protein
MSRISAVLLVLCLVSSAHAEDSCSLHDRLATKGNCLPTWTDWVFVQGFDFAGGKLIPEIFNALSWLPGEKRWAPVDGWQFAEGFQSDFAKSHGLNVVSGGIGAAAAPSIMMATTPQWTTICASGFCTINSVGGVATGATLVAAEGLVVASTTVAGASTAIAGSAVGGTALGTAAVTAGTATAAALSSTAAAVVVAAPAIATAAVCGAAVYTVRSVFNWVLE